MAQAAQRRDDAATGHGLGARLPQFDTSGAEAYAAPGDDGHYLLLHHPTVPMRADIVDGVKRIRRSALLELAEQKIMRLGGVERLVSVVEKPPGPSLADIANGRGLPDRILREQVVPSVLVMLRALHGTGLTHRGLNAGRIYQAVGDGTQVKIGECFSAPAGIDQPTVYEPIERSDASPVSRGEGGPEDDYYAFGVMLLALLLGRDLADGRTDDQILAAKISNGSYVTLVKGASLVGGTAGLVRGLLADNPAERWGAEEILAWTDGMARTSGSTLAGWNLSRPVHFRDRLIGDRRQLAAEMAQDVPAAATFIRGLGFGDWLTQFLPGLPNTPDLAKLVLLGQTARRTDGRNSSIDQLVMRFCMMLDPVGPIRYRSLTIMADGVGPALAAAQQAPGEARQTMLEIATSQILPTLQEIQTTVHPSGRREQLAKDVARLGRLIHRKIHPDANERALYGLNPGLPCQSGIFSGLWIGDCRALLLAANAIAEKSADRLAPTDPHFTAYLAARDNDAFDLFNSAGRGDPAAAAAALLAMFAAFQKKFDVGSLKPLSGYFSRRLMPLVRNLKSKTRRNRAEQRLNELADSGDLSLMVEQFDIDRLGKLDGLGFARARTQLHWIDRRLHELGGVYLGRHPLPTIHGGRGAAMLGAAVLAMSLLARLV